MPHREFEIFFRKMHPRLLRFGMRSLDIDAASSAAIDTLHTMWSKHPGWMIRDEDQDRMEGLAYAIMKGIIRNHLRADGRRARLVAALVSEQRTLTNTG